MILIYNKHKYNYKIVKFKIKQINYSLIMKIDKILSLIKF